MCFLSTTIIFFVLFDIKYKLVYNTFNLNHTKGVVVESIYLLLGVTFTIIILIVISLFFIFFRMISLEIRKKKLQMILCSLGAYTEVGDEQHLKICSLRRTADGFRVERFNGGNLELSKKKIVIFLSSYKGIQFKEII